MTAFRSFNSRTVLARAAVNKLQPQKGMSMQQDIEQLKRDYEDYRRTHGDKSLFTYVSWADRKLYIVKKSSESTAELVEVFGDAEKQITLTELDADYCIWIQDEMILVFGSSAQKEAALTMSNAVSTAIQRIVYSKSKLPLVIEAAA